MIDQYTKDELSRVASLPELSSGRVSKSTAMAALNAIRAVEQIAGIPIGRNPLGEAQQMREIASSILAGRE